MLSFYLLSSTELIQLLKLPVLVDHYIEHRQKDRDISLFSFLHMHYAEGDVQDADHDKDMKLPFKSHNSCTAFALSVFVAVSHQAGFEFPMIYSTNVYSTYHHFTLPSGIQNGIWQPPKQEVRFFS